MLERSDSIYKKDPIAALRLFQDDVNVNKQYFIYIATNVKHTVLYTGITNNLIKRGFQHKIGQGSFFTSKYKVTKIVYYEISQEPLEAIKREKQIKNLVRRKKIMLINELNPTWSDLIKDLV